MIEEWLFNLLVKSGKDFKQASSVAAQNLDKISEKDENN